MKVTAVIPAFNEATRIGATIAGVLPYVQEVVVVDDGSTDATVDRAREAGAFALRHPINRGQGAALKTGTIMALLNGADIIIHIDADGQHDPVSIPSLVDTILKNETDIVFGSRFLSIAAEGMPHTRRLLLAGIKRFNNYLLGIPYTVTDPQSGLRAMSSEVARQLDFTQDRMAHCSEILRLVTRSSWRWMEVPTCVRYTADSLKKGQKAMDAFGVVWQLLLGTFRK